MAWRESPERARLTRVWWIIGGFVLVVAVIGAFVGYSIGGGQAGKQLSALAGAGFSAALVGYIGLVIRLLYASQLKKAFKDRQLLGLAKEELRQAEEGITGGETDFSSLWAVTQKRLDYYHKIATTQSERSFLYGQIAAGMGFAVLLTRFRE